VRETTVSEQEQAPEQQAGPVAGIATAPAAPGRVTSRASVLALQRTAGNRAVAQMIQRYKVNARDTVLPGDVIPVEIRNGMRGEPLTAYSRKYKVEDDGTIAFADSRGKFTVKVGGLEVGFAARAIADRFVDEGRLEDPQVSVTSADGYAAGGAGSAKGGLRGKKSPFEAYIRTVKEPAEAVARYYAWLAAVKDPKELDAITPPELWAMALKKPPGPARDPRDVHIDEFLRFMEHQLEIDRRTDDPKERERRTRTMSLFLDWFERNKEAPGFLRKQPEVIYADLSVRVLKESIEKKVKADLEAEKDKALTSPESLKERQEKWNEYYALSLKLFGYSSRRFPYTIPVPSEGRDILVTGDPELQKVLDRIASELMSYALDHFFDSDYTRKSAIVVLADLVKSSKYDKQLAEAQKKPLEHESFDRNEILGDRAFASFGETLGKGLLVIAVVGLFVGAEVITAGQATWILVGVAGTSGVASYIGRRDEIEKKGYDVPVPATIIHSAGDAVGVSQLVEGITGERLGTDEKLGSMRRSDSLGEGGANVALLLAGSKAYRQGEALGTKFKVPEAPKLPKGPNANTDVPIPDAPMPATPKPNAKAGPVEQKMRAGLPDELKLGFDKWMEETRAGGRGEPEKFLDKMGARRVEEVSRQYVRKHEGEVARAEESAYLKERAADNPLRPLLKNTKQVGDKVWIHYENVPPEAADIPHAEALAKAKGEPVHLFGDTASKQSYPGIDGTIGNPPRPLSLKSHSLDANAGSARFAAQEALAKAKAQGYTQVEVSIEMPGKTVAEVKAAWDVKADVPGAHELGPYYEGKVIAKLEIRCKDGVWSPPKGKVLSGPAPNFPKSDDEKKK
jgi:hypothetical protein